MKKILVLSLLIVALYACTGDTQDIKRILETDGCTNIELTGYDPFGCSKNDDYSCGFTATKNGRAVKGVVCSGVWKGHTIRYY